MPKPTGALVFLSLALLAGCSDSASESPGGDAPAGAPDAPAAGPDARPATPDAGMGITATAGSWTWVDFPDSACDDGSPTGIGVNPSPTGSKNLLIFLNGGGACWSYQTCVQLPFSVHGPYGMTQFAHDSAGFAGVLDRSDANNPFADWNLVFVPYCTGDVHGGQKVTTYTAGSAMATFHHVGHLNVVAYLARLVPTFPAPDKLVVSGSSAGGFGAAYNYPTVRQAFGAKQSYLLDDSGPVLEGDAIMAALRDAYRASWGTDLILDPLCGDPCHTDLSAAFAALAAAYPTDRLALLSSLQDQTIRTFFQLAPADFQTDLLKMAADRLDPTANFHYFFVDGQTHTMLGSPATFMSKGTPLYTWITQEITDAAGWASSKP